MSGIHLFTIATASHVDIALAAMISAKSHSPCTHAAIYLVDREPEVGEAAGVEILRISDEIQRIVSEGFPKDYSWAEVCFALKPLLIEAELDRGATTAAYIDSDVFFVSDIAPTLETCSRHAVGLTPHYLRARTPQQQPSELTLLRAGLYNGGFVSTSACPNGRAFLSWWQDRTRRLGYNLPRAGMCGDQRWLDLAPVLFEGTCVLRNEGLNVAYWNMDERPVTMSDDGRFRVGVTDMVFFHFSGFRRSHPEEVSVYAATRKPTAANQHLRALCRTYLSAIEAAGEQSERVNQHAAPNAIARWYQANAWRRGVRRLRSPRF